MSKHDAKKRYGVMFCGFGGSCSGAHQAGLECAFAIDNNDRIKVPLRPDEEDSKDLEGKEGVDWEWHERLPAIQTREKNFKDGKGMIMGVDEFKPAAKHAARYVTASPPCKRFSTSAETWENEGDDDNEDLLDLDTSIKELGFVAIQKALKVPEMEYYVMENVTGLLTRENKPYLDKMVEMLKSAGCSVEYQIFNSYDLGCCQLRERVILVASKSGRKNLLPEAPAGIKKKIFADIIEDELTVESAARVKKAKWPQSTYLAFVAKMMRGAGQMRVVIPSIEEAKLLGWEPLSLKAFNHGDVLPTIACNAGGGPTRKKWTVLPFNGQGYRNATILEALRAQDFDDAWLANLPANESQAWSMIGNAVPRALMYHIMKHLVALDAFYDGETKSPPASCDPLDPSWVKKTPMPKEKKVLKYHGMIKPSFS